MHAQAIAGQRSFRAFTGPVGAMVLRPEVGPGRRLDQVDTTDLLGRMAALRAELGRVRRQLRAGSIPERTFASLAGALDGSAELITGEASLLGDA